jgi:hypothetical protein
MIAMLIPFAEATNLSKNRNHTEIFEEIFLYFAGLIKPATILQYFYSDESGNFTVTFFLYSLFARP